MKIFEKFLNPYSDRIVGLDILRSIAILRVIYDHGAGIFPEQYQNIFRDINLIEIDGVSIFFVLSGFLIGQILLRTITNSDYRSKDLVNFWIRRWFRTVPNYLLVLIGVLIYSLLKNKDYEDFSFLYLIFSQNFLTPHPGFYFEAWSLPVEEWFYLLFPLSCYVFHKTLKNKTKSIFISALVFLLFPLILRIIKYEYGIGINDFDVEFRKIMILRLDSIMYGVISAILMFKYSYFWGKFKYSLLFIGILLLTLLKINPYDWKNFYHPIYYNFEAITTMCFLPFFCTYKTTKSKLFDSFFVFISVISYSIYLINYTPVLKYFLSIFNGLFLKHSPTNVLYIWDYIVYIIVTISGSYFLYKLYEKPMTKLREKIKIK